MTTGRHINLNPPLHPMLGIAFINFILVIIALVIFFSFFATPSAFEIRMPVTAEDSMEDAHVSVHITSENVLYFNDKVVTINDLKRDFLKINPANTVVYLQVDRRASTGRLADVWDLCKGLGIARVKIVATQDI